MLRNCQQKCAACEDKSEVIDIDTHQLRGSPVKRRVWITSRFYNLSQRETDIFGSTVAWLSDVPLDAAQLLKQQYQTTKPWCDV